MNAKASPGEYLKDYFSLQGSSIRAFGLVFALVGTWYLFDYLPVVWQLTKPEGFLNLTHSAAHYPGTIPNFVLMVPSSVLVCFSTFLLTCGLILIFINQYPRIGFVCVGVAIYLTSFRIRPLIYGGNNTLIWSAVIGATLPHVRDQAARQRRFFSLTTVAVYIQIFSIYFQSGIHKAGPGWTSTFTATETALRNPHYLNSAGVWLADFSWLSKLLTLAVMVLEVPLALIMLFGFFAPILFRHKYEYGTRIKTTFALAATLFHVGTAIFLNLRFFPYASIALVLLLIGFSPPAGKQPNTTVYFDFDKRLILFQLITILIILCGTIEVKLPNWVPSQKFRYFSPIPDTKFVDVEIEALGQNSERLALYHPFHSDDLEIPDFYRKRIQWAVSRFFIKSRTWTDFYCHKLEASDARTQIRLNYVWSQFDDHNIRRLEEKRYVHAYFCGPTESAI